MDSDLISKKELLDLADISYGQLYRWKRKALIPEDWFIRKSTFTGQETFFPKDKILPRIEKIKEMKDNLSLDELADMFSPRPSDLNLNKEQLLNRNIVSLEVLERYATRTGTPGEYSFFQVFHMYILNRLLQTGEITLAEGETLLDLFLSQSPEGIQKGELLLIRKMGISVFLLTLEADQVIVEQGAKVRVKLSLHECVETLKGELMK